MEADELRIWDMGSLSLPTPTPLPMLHARILTQNGQPVGEYDISRDVKNLNFQVNYALTDGNSLVSEVHICDLQDSLHLPPWNHF